MTGRERILNALNHKEPDRVPYDLAGTTVTGITRNAYIRAMQFRGMALDIASDENDPIQQIVTPSEENLVRLQADARRIGAHRIPEYRKNVRHIGKHDEVTDFYGCNWRRDPGKDLYFNQVSYPLMNFETLSGALQNLTRISWSDYIRVLYINLDEQVKQVNDFCGIADRNTAGLTENSLRIRGYENWFMDTVMDPMGVEALLDIILEDKIVYWNALIDWALKTGNENKIQVISECDDLGSQKSTILDPALLRQMVVPRYKILFSLIKKRLPHVRIFMHSCGAIYDLIPDLIDAGMDILNPVQFTAGGMGIKRLKKDFGRSITFWAAA